MPETGIPYCFPVGAELSGSASCADSHTLFPWQTCLPKSSLLTNVDVRDRVSELQQAAARSTAEAVILNRVTAQIIESFYCGVASIIFG
jgi:hypothetical protein